MRFGQGEEEGQHPRAEVGDGRYGSRYRNHTAVNEMHLGSYNWKVLENSRGMGRPRVWFQNWTRLEFSATAFGSCIPLAGSLNLFVLRGWWKCATGGSLLLKL